MTIELIRTIVQISAGMATVIGVPVGLYVFWHQKRKDRTAREMEVYLGVYDRYLSYLTLLLERPELGWSEYAEGDEDLRAAGLSPQQATMYIILFMTLEQIHFQHNRAKLIGKAAIWAPWDKYLQWWISRPDFQKAWSALDPWTHPDLHQRIEAEIKKSREIASKEGLK